MDDLIGLNMDAPPAATASKPTDSLIDFDIDGMDDAPPPVLASNPTPIPAASSTTIVNAEEAARAWKDCLEASHDKVQYPLVPVIEGPFVNGPLDEFEEMWGAKTNGKHDFSKCDLFSSFSFLSFLKGKVDVLPHIESPNCKSRQPVTYYCSQPFPPPHWPFRGAYHVITESSPARPPD